MRSLLILSSLWTLAFVHGDVQLDLPAFVVDLDLPSIDRWSTIIPNFSQPMREFNEQIREQIPRAFIDVAELVATRLDQHIPAPYHDEFYSIARAIDMPLADIVLINLVYELRTFCTSLLVRTANGTILHGRNLDFDLNPDLLRQLTFRGRFVRSSNASFHYESIHFAGSIGLLTACRPGHFSLSINQRDLNEKHWWMNALMAFLHLQAKPMFLFTRTIFDDPSMSFQDMKDTLQSEHLIAPVYLIITDGRASGWLITRNRLDSINPLQLLDSILVQTNYDHWLIDPPDDLRRTTAEQILRSWNTTEFTGDRLFQIVLSVVPVLNQHTIYTALMNPAEEQQQEMQAKIRTLLHSRADL